MKQVLKDIFNVAVPSKLCNMDIIQPWILFSIHINYKIQKSHDSSKKKLY